MKRSLTDSGPDGLEEYLRPKAGGSNEGDVGNFLTFENMWEVDMLWKWALGYALCSSNNKRQSG